ADALYDAQEWLAGSPLTGASPMGPREPVPNVVRSVSPARLAILAGSLARFHVSTAHISPEPGDQASPLSVRLNRIMEATEARYESLLPAVLTGTEGPELHVALRWLELLPKAVEAAHEACGDFPEGLRRGYALCHGDLWPAHVYFEGDAFVGFTDFESLCFASPALDLAQLLLHFGGWEIREEVLRDYDRLAPLDERDRSLVPLEAVADLADEGFWALEALYGVASYRTTAAQRAAHSLNLRELLVSLEPIAEEIR
ncbi:MAG: phosphotransferase, partial [Actinomycetota bacterium]|nr:phosphotransferase [Actinomycetota bacterium]